MEQKSLNSVKIKSVPEKEISIQLEKWAYQTSLNQKEIVRVGYFGSYARGDYAPSSDLDVLIIIQDSNKLPHKRLIDYSIDNFPVGCELFVYTQKELLEVKNSWFNTILSEVKWVYQRG